MQLQPLRRLVAGSAFAVVACTQPPRAPGPPAAPRSPIAAFLVDRGARLAAMEASLPTDAGAYSSLRRARYAAADASSWERLPTWNPPTRAWTEREGEPFTSGEAESIAIDPACASGDLAALRALGAIAFTRYPAQRAPFELATLSRAARREIGLSVGADGRIAALVEVEGRDGGRTTSLTCATCHARPTAARDRAPFALGATNDALDFGLAMLEGARARHASIEGAASAALSAWGPGRVDVTTTDGREPVHVPDLRAVRFERYLQASGAVEQRDVTSLAVRIETLLVTAHGEAVRPPREIAVGLALYLWSLADALPPLDRSAPGAAVFSRSCGRCHQGEGLSGGRIEVDRVGTDPIAARSSERGTGAYRVPSLRGVGTRGALLHDASIASLDALLDPARASGGHRFGADLSAAERTAIVAWLRTL
jgi:cytochrome c5